MLNATVFVDFQTPCCRCRFQDDDDKHIIKRDHFHLCRFSPIEARNSKSFMVFLPQRFPCHWRLRNDFRSGLGMHAKMWTNGRRRIFAKVQNDIPMPILKLQLTLSNPTQNCISSQCVKFTKKSPKKLRRQIFEFSLKIDKIENKTNLKNRQNCKLDKIEK